MAPGAAPARSSPSAPVRAAPAARCHTLRVRPTRRLPPARRRCPPRSRPLPASTAQCSWLAMLPLRLLRAPLHPVDELGGGHLSACFLADLAVLFQQDEPRD